MSDDLDLARRAVACRAWRWLPGMISSDEVRVCRVDPDGGVELGRWGRR